MSTYRFIKAVFEIDYIIETLQFPP
jgi:hypothetical protein